MSLDAFAALARIGPVVRTGDAVAALKTSQSHASRLLRALATRGLAHQVRYGLWILGTNVVDPRSLADEITRPYPSYVSFLSALSAHGMIDQLPRDIALASLDNAKQVKTTLGSFTVHHLPPDLFGGWIERDDVKLARPEKALFDLAYVSAAHRGRHRRVPELDLPKGFDRKELRRWINRIASPRLRTLTLRGLAHLLGRVRGGEVVRD